MGNGHLPMKNAESSGSFRHDWMIRLDMLRRLLLFLLQTVFLAETWLRAVAKGAKRRCKQILNSLLDAVPFPFSLLLNWLLPRQSQPAGRVPGPPRTIALVLAENAVTKPSLRKVADVISWCAQTGLAHITVYDPKGHLKVQQHDLAHILSEASKSTSPYSFTVEAGYPMLTKGAGILSTPRPLVKGTNGSAAPDLDIQSPRSCASDRCSVSSLSTSPDSIAPRRQPGGESPSVTATARSALARSSVEVSLLSAEDSHAPLVAAARQGRISGPSGQPTTDNTALSNGVGASAKLGAVKTNGERAGGSRMLQDRGSSSTLIAARPPSRLVAAAAVAKAESSGDLMGFLSMLAAGQTNGGGPVDSCARDDSDLRLKGPPLSESFQNGYDGACSEASTSSFTFGSSVDLFSRAAAAERASNGAGPSGGGRSSSLDLFDGDAWLPAAEREGSGADGEDWVAKKGSLRWIRQRGGNAQADGGGPIRRRARKGPRARGDMGYALLRSPWSWGDSPAAAADKQFVAEPDQDPGMLRSVSNGGLSHDSDSAFGCDQCFADHEEGQLECSRASEKGDRGKLFSMSGGQSTEDLLNAFTKDLEAAVEPQPKALAKGPDFNRVAANMAKELLTPAELDNQMATLAGAAAVREPDLVLVFGRTFTLAGYPPWPIRFSEIYHMGDLGDFTRGKLTDALHRYCRTPQRFGT